MRLPDSKEGSFSSSERDFLPLHPGAAAGTAEDTSPEERGGLTAEAPMGFALTPAHSAFRLPGDPSAFPVSPKAPQAAQWGSCRLQRGKGAPPSPYQGREGAMGKHCLAHPEQAWDVFSLVTVT